MPQLSAYAQEKKREEGVDRNRFSSPELYKSTKAVAHRIFSSKRTTVPEIVDKTLSQITYPLEIKHKNVFPAKRLATGLKQTQFRSFLEAKSKLESCIQKKQWPGKKTNITVKISH